MNPTVSVIIPTYNRAGRVPEAIRSVLKQSYRPLELVVVDDGSSDNTFEVLQELKDEVVSANATYQVVRKENGGVASARNAGIAAATGDWIAFLDDDDRWEPEKLTLQMQMIETTGADACSALCLVLDPSGYSLVPEENIKLLDGRNPADYIRGERHSHINSIVASKSVVHAAGEFDTELVVAEDIEWIARLVHEAVFCTVEKVLLSYNRLQPKDSLTNVDDLSDELRKHKFREKAILLMKERCSDRDGWDESAWRHRVGLEYRRVVRHRIRNKRYKEAVTLFERGMQLSLGAKPLAQLTSKVRKARLKALFSTH